MSIHILFYSTQHNFNLFRRFAKLPIVFTTFFAVPTVTFHRVGKVISGVEFSYPPMSGWNLVHASSYSCPFLISAIANTRPFHGRQLTTASHLLEYYESRSPLSRSVFGVDRWIALYRVSDYALSNYHRRGLGLSSRDGLAESTRGELLLLARTSVQLLSESVP